MDGRTKKGLDKIIDIPFPNVDPSLTMTEVREKIANDLIKKIEKIEKNEVNEMSVYLAGDFSLCFMIYNEFSGSSIFVFPSTKRVVEVINGQKISSFKFVRWR